MEKFMPDVRPSERLAILRDTAHSVTDQPQYVALSKEELDQRRETFTEIAVKLHELDEEKKDFMDLHKEKVKPVKLEYTDLLNTITIGKERRDGQFFNVVSDDTGTMITYDENGEWVSERRLTPEEKKGQSRLFIPAKMKTGTHE